MISSEQIGTYTEQTNYTASGRANFVTTDGHNNLQTSLNNIINFLKRTKIENIEVTRTIATSYIPGTYNHFIYLKKVFNKYWSLSLKT